MNQEETEQGSKPVFGTKSTLTETLYNQPLPFKLQALFDYSVAIHLYRTMEHYTVTNEM